MNYTRRILPLAVHLLPLLLVFSVCVAAFGYGLVVGRFKVFPYALIRDARVAAAALVGTVGPAENNGLAKYQRTVLQPTAIQHGPLPGDELILVSSGADALRSLHPDGCLAWIMDRQGQVRHSYRNDPQLWRDLQQVTRVPGVSGPISPVGLHLFDNGDLLATFHGFNTFPFAVGMARFDRDSKLLWKKELLTHHCFSVAEDGRIFVPALEVRDAPAPIGAINGQIESATGKIYHDLLLVLAPDGNVLERISMLDALVQSGWQGLLLPGNGTSLTSDDPLHLNDVQFVGAALADQHPWLEAEDLLVSLRNINTVGILDARTHRFKWISTGATIGQHSPRAFDRGVLVLDNLGGDQQLGGTRLVGIDLATRQPAVVFPRAGVPMPDLCRTANSGHVDLHPSGDRALLTITHEGAVWEIELATGRVIWEYIQVQPDGTGARRGVALAKYVRTPSFLNP